MSGKCLRELWARLCQLLLGLCTCGFGMVAYAKRLGGASEKSMGPPAVWSSSLTVALCHGQSLPAGPARRLPRKPH